MWAATAAGWVWRTFLSILESIQVTRLPADDESRAAVLKLDSLFGGLPFHEHFHVIAGQILTIRAHYDPRPVLEALMQKA